MPDIWYQYRNIFSVGYLESLQMITFEIEVGSPLVYDLKVLSSDMRMCQYSVQKISSLF